jgi:uncharacterized membrane protein (DUF485 family)
MSKLSGPELTSYAGSIASIGASLTLTDVGVIVGIVTALLTFVINAVYIYRKDKRDQVELKATIEKVKEDSDVTKS